MSVLAVKPHLLDPQFHDALHICQRGQWDIGLTRLAEVAERFPHDTELRVVIQEMKLRSKIDRDEREDLQRLRMARLKKWAGRGIAALALVIVGSWSFITYAVQLQVQVTSARQVMEAKLFDMELSTKLANAMVLLRAERVLEAKALLAEIATANPQFPGLDTAIQQANTAADLSARYAQAATLIEAHQWDEARTLLESVAADQPNYRDVAQLLGLIDEQQRLGAMLVAAEDAYQQQHWVDAAAAFEQLRASAPEYETDQVSAHLFESYVNAARQSLVGQEDSLEALRAAEIYFRKALALRPQDPGIKSERELAGLYLKAQVDFNANRYTDVITGLEIVYQADPGYANGTARQTLYEAHMLRGDSYAESGAYEPALVDFQSALKIAGQDRVATLRIYEANLKAAEVQAAQGEYESATVYYRAAIDISNLRQRAVTIEAWAGLLASADSLATQGNYSVAVDTYRKAINYTEVEHKNTIHVVKEGEYLTLIAARYGSTVSAIVAANDKIKNANKIYVGQELVIPLLP